jgi:hypothetical protein
MREPAESRAFDRRALRIHGIDLDDPTETERLIGLVRQIEARIDGFPCIG